MTVIRTELGDITARHFADAIVKAVVRSNPGAFDEILWVLFDERTKLLYDGALQGAEFKVKIW